MESANSPNEKSLTWSRLALLLWVVVLGWWVYRTRSATVNVSVYEMMGRAALVALLRELMLSAVSSFVLYLPLGYLMALSIPARVSAGARLLRVWAAPLGAALLIAAGLVTLQRGSPLWQDFVLPCTACLIGYWAGVAWLEGSSARSRFLRLVVGILAALGLVFAFVLVLAFESKPLSSDAQRITSDEKRQLYAKFSGKNPKKLPKGEIVELRFTTDELNSALAWGSSVVTWVRTAHIELIDSRAELRASAAVPRTPLFLNLTLVGGVKFSDGKLALSAERLRVGHLEFPRSLIGAMVPLVNRIANEDERSKQVLQLLQSVELGSGELSVRYGHSEPSRGLLARLFRDPGATSSDIPEIRSQIDHLLAAAGNMPEDTEARLASTVLASFRHAHEHTSPGQAVAQNRAALLALGIVLGHERIQSLTGPVMDDRTADAVKKAFASTTLRSRADWTKHFFVSAALTVIAAEDVSNATGLFKEEKDADGGSGFSFADLLADRAGTTFAETATRSEASARSLQERLMQGFKLDDYFPEAKDLPENIQDAELKARYGGVGGVEYKRWIAEIERRVAACPAYRE